MKILSFLFLSAFSATSFANDTVATVETGNVVFKKSKEISMDSEVLRISPSKISVKYLFKNGSKKAIEETVVFPLPPSHSESGGWHAPDPANPKNTLNFVLKINGQEKPFKIHSRKEILDKEYDTHIIHSFYSWQQVFPPGKSPLVEHEYDTNPGSGGSLKFDEETKKKYCIDKSFLKAFEKLKIRTLKKISSQGAANAKQNAPDLESYMHFNSFSHVSYILTTGSNWAGPIKKFKLVVEKDKPSTLVTFCWDSLKKISDLEFESEKENFLPTKDLYILFVHDK